MSLANFAWSPVGRRVMSPRSVTGGATTAVRYEIHERESGEILGKALRGRREHVVLATKAHGAMGIAADAGVSLTHMALAFVMAHPGVTSAIIGPRTMDQLTDLMAGASVRLTDDMLDRIDQIVPPGVTLNWPADAGWQPPVLTDAAGRRRPLPDRSAV